MFPCRQNLTEYFIVRVHFGSPAKRKCHLALATDYGIISNLTNFRRQSIQPCCRSSRTYHPLSGQRYRDHQETLLAPSKSMSLRSHSQVIQSTRPKRISAIRRRTSRRCASGSDVRPLSRLLMRLASTRDRPPTIATPINPPANHVSAKCSWPTILTLEAAYYGSLWIDTSKGALRPIHWSHTVTQAL